MRRHALVALSTLIVVAACGDADSDGSGPASAPSTTVQAPLRPELRETATGGVGTIPVWVADWTTVNALLASNNADFPLLPLDLEQLIVGVTDAGLTVFRGPVTDGVLVGGALAADDGGITSLLLVGSPEDPDFLAAFNVWLATLNPQIDAFDLLPLSMISGEETSVALNVDGRAYEAALVDSGEVPLIAVTMVPGVGASSEVDASAHALLRRELLQDVTIGE